MMKKKWLFGFVVTFALFLLMCLPIFIGNATNASETGSGMTGECTWVFDNGVLTISGKGAMEDYTISSNAPWETTVTELIIEEGVTRIGEYAFYGCSRLTKITIPEGVISIGGSAFRDCSGLTNITIPEGVTSIDSAVFRGCGKLTDITIPEGVTSINSYTFYGCSGLTNITIPEGVTRIGIAAFKGCSKLTNITIPEGVTSIDNVTFSSCSGLTNITIPEGVTSIGSSAFQDCSGLTNITIPEGVTSIGGSAFRGCSKLTDITIPEGVARIKQYTFQDCSGLTNITIPEGVTTIESDAFRSCYLDTVYYGGTTEWWEALNESDYINYDNIVYYNLAKIGMTTLPITLEYHQYEDEISLTGGVLTLYYNDDITETVSLDKATITGFDNTKPGIQELTVSYLGQTTTYEVKIIEGETPSEPVEPEPAPEPDPEAGTVGELTWLNGNLYSTLGEINVLANGYAPATHWMSNQAEAFHGVNGMLLEFQPTTGKWVVTQSYVGQNIIAPNTVLQSGKIGYDEATGTITMAIFFHTNAWSEYGESYYFFEKNNVLGKEFYMVGDFWTVVTNANGSTKNDTAISGLSLTTVEPEDYFGKPGETPSEPGEGTTKGQLKIDALGGTGFIVEINGVKRPQGNSYTNSQIAIGTEVTVTAKEVSGAEFMGWVDVPINKIVSTDLTYSFFTSGNDQYKAMYNSSVSMEIDGVTQNAYMVMFQNDISNQILDMQYYFAGDEVVYPSDPVRPGYKFVEWSHSEEEIQAALEKGEDVTVTPVWEAVKTYVNVLVENGTVDSYTEMVDGKYLAISKMTVTADTPARGQKFAYWVEVDKNGNEIIKSYSSSYTLYPSKDLTLKAVYVDEATEIDYQVLVNMDAVKTTTTPTEIYLSWYVPVEENGYTFNSAGFIMVNKVNYNEDTFVLGSMDANVRKGQTNDASINAISYTTSRIATGDTWMMRAFVQYQDENGVTQVKYSDLIEVTKN